MTLWLNIISFGHKRDALFAAATAEYQQRMKPPWKLKFTDLVSARRNETEPATTVLKREAILLHRHLPEKSDIIALDASGTLKSSEEFSAWLLSLEQRGQKNICFVLGSADGLDVEFKKQATAILSLSRLTFSHRLARAVLCEQIYRAQSIILGTAYHK